MKNRLFGSIGHSLPSFLTLTLTSAIATASLCAFTSAASATDIWTLRLAAYIISIFLFSLFALACVTSTDDRVGRDRELIKAQLAIGANPGELLRGYLSYNLLAAVIGVLVGMALGTAVLENIVLRALESDLGFKADSLAFALDGAIVSAAAAIIIAVVSARSALARAIVGVNSIGLPLKAGSAAIFTGMLSACSAMAFSGEGGAVVTLVAEILTLISAIPVMLGCFAATSDARASECALMRLCGCSEKRIRAYLVKKNLTQAIIGAVIGVIFAIGLTFALSSPLAASVKLVPALIGFAVSAAASVTIAAVSVGLDGRMGN